LVIESKRAWQALGRVQLDTQKAEEASRQFRRSVYVVKDIAAGEVFSVENIKVIRPGDGAPPSRYEALLGKTSRVALKRGTPLKENLI
jgi:sialic acid synthase SpsE